MTRQIAERTPLEEQLKENEERFRSLVETATVLRDSQGKLVGFSKVTKDLTERKRADDHGGDDCIDRP